jgi:hypothetical protein
MALRKRLWRALLRRIGCDAESFSTVLWPWCPKAFRRMKQRRGLRRAVAEYCRYLADRIGPEDAFCHTGMRFYNLINVGTAFIINRHDIKEGTPIYYRRSEHDGEIYEERLG